jgi:hypothetical protein
MRQLFFGTIERTLGWLALLVSIVSLIASAYIFINAPSATPAFIVVRDLSIWLVTLIFLTFFVIGFVHRGAVIERKVEEIRQKERIIWIERVNLSAMLSELLKPPHELAHNFRNILFNHYLQPNGHTIHFTQEEKNVFDDICKYAIKYVKKSFETYFKYRGISIENDFSVSVKLILRSDQSPLLSQLSSEYQTLVKTQKEWIITAYRDEDTTQGIDRNEREVGTRLYDIKNYTAFSRIVLIQDSVFFSNDLEHEQGYYNEDETDWHKYYNSILIVPIRYRRQDGTQHRCFGLLIIDSLNINKEKLYNDSECKDILSNAADLISIFFLLLEQVEYGRSQGGQHVQSPAEGGH